MSWVPKVLIHLINCTVVNSFLIYKFIHLETVTKEFSLTIFIEQLMTNLAEEWLQESRRSTSDIRNGNNTRKLSQWNKDDSRRQGSHWPIQVNVPARPNKKSDKIQRSYCLICSRKINTKCRECGVFLCLNENVDGNNCFFDFHNVEDFADYRRPIPRRPKNKLIKK